MLLTDCYWLMQVPVVVVVASKLEPRGEWSRTTTELERKRTLGSLRFKAEI